MNTRVILSGIFSSDPYFVPEISVKGVTFNSITIGWSQPPGEMRDHVHYYMLIVQNNSTTKEAIHPEQSMNLFLFTDLQSATTYRFKVSAFYEDQIILGGGVWGRGAPYKCRSLMLVHKSVNICCNGREDLNSTYCEAGSLPVLEFEELFFCCLW